MPEGRKETKREGGSGEEGDEGVEGGLKEGEERDRDGMREKGERERVREGGSMCVRACVACSFHAM